MPRNVRNFWHNLVVDGRSTDIGTGPVSKDGGFSQTMLIRHEGRVVTAVLVEGRPTRDGRLRLSLHVSPEALREGVQVKTTYTNGCPELVLEATR